MTKQEIYEQVVFLTAELNSKSFAKNIFDTAKEGDSKKVEEVFETFKKENPDLYQKIVKLGKEYTQLWKKCNVFEVAHIFGSTENNEEGVHILDIEKIDSLSLCALMFLAEIDDYYMFQWDCKSYKIFVDTIATAGYTELMAFLIYHSWIDYIGEDTEEYSNIYELLVAIFKGKFKDEN